MKKRILVATDASFLSSGYGVYAKELLTRMHNSGKYEVAELGAYATINSPEIKNIPWKFYPNAVEKQDNRYEAYKSSANNQFGAWRFNRVCANFKPHIVCTWTDYWMYSYQETSPYRKYFSWIQMPMVDSAPQKIEWLHTYSNADVIIPYTEWAQKVLTEACGKHINLFYRPANAGINSNEFFPLNNKTEHKIQLLGGDYDVVGCVMRNQQRKLFADTMLVFKKYLDRLKDEDNLEKYNKTYLYLHTSYPEEKGWDLPALLAEYNLLDKVYFSYVCRSCKHYFPSKFKNAMTTCSKCNNISATFPSVAASLSTAALNLVYNSFDFFIQNAIAEGFGITQLEAAACGVPFASVDYSAMSEVSRNLRGVSIPVQRLFRELETNADRAYPDNNFTANLIYDFFNKWTPEDKRSLSQETRSLCLNKYTWDHVYGVWDECLETIDINTKKPWDSSEISTTNHADIKIPPNLNPKEFIDYICLYVLNEPNFLHTAQIQTLLKDLSGRLVARNGMITSFDYNRVVEILEAHLNNKIACEKIRTENIDLREDFLNVSNQSNPHIV
jgi:glycosyltransferase involved in cell wall biosynthesis